MSHEPMCNQAHLAGKSSPLLEALTMSAELDMSGDRFMVYLSSSSQFSSPRSARSLMLTRTQRQHSHRPSVGYGHHSG